MSRGRGLFVTMFKDFMKSLKPRSFKGTEKGTDHLGNTYYEIIPPGHSTKSRPSRYYIPKHNDSSKFDEPVPAEWESWLRLRRKEPPTPEEIQKNLDLMKMTKANALELDKKYTTQKLDAGDEPPASQTVTGVKEFPDYPEYEKAPGKGPR